MKSKLPKQPNPVNATFDHSCLSFGVNQAMAASLFLIDDVNWMKSKSEPPMEILTVGLGGGSLPMYLKTCFSHLVVTMLCTL